MLSALAIANDRSLRRLVLPLRQLTLVTGPDGSGKSSVCRALRMLAAVAQGGMVRSLARSWAPRRRCRATMAAAWQTIRDIGDRAALDAAVEDAFPGACVQIDVLGERFALRMRQHGLLRPLDSAEISDATLRYLLWIAALPTPRPPALLVLNEPETSLHTDLLPALGVARALHQRPCRAAPTSARKRCPSRDGGRFRLLTL